MLSSISSPHRCPPARKQTSPHTRRSRRTPPLTSRHAAPTKIPARHSGQVPISWYLSQADGSPHRDCFPSCHDCFTSRRVLIDHAQRQNPVARSLHHPASSNDILFSLGPPRGSKQAAFQNLGKNSAPPSRGAPMGRE